MKAILALALGLASATCANKTGPRTAAPAATYTARGQITWMANGDRSKEVEIHHETIPTFRDRAGKLAGMPSMAMSFKVTPSAALAGFKVTDKVQLTFDVVWSDSSPLRLTKLEHLPADTALVLE